MRKTLLVTAAVLGLAAGMANAQTYQPQAMGENSPEHYLQAAQDALARHQRFVARDALEHAETRLLDRSENPSMTRQPDTSPLVQQIAEARRAIDRGDDATAKQLISKAMSSASAAGAASPGGMGSGTMSPGTMGSGSMGAGGMEPGSMGSRQAPMPGAEYPGQPAPMNEGAGMDNPLPARR